MDRGQDADSPTRIGASGLTDIFRRPGAGMARDHARPIGAGTASHGPLALAGPGGPLAHRDRGKRRDRGADRARHHDRPGGAARRAA